MAFMTDRAAADSAIVPIGYRDTYGVVVSLVGILIVENRTKP